MKNNLILLVLIVVLQVSCKKTEVLSSFTIMNSKIEESIEINTIANSTYLDVIYSKAKSNGSYIKHKETANKVHEISLIFSKYLEDLKNVIKEKNTTEFVDEYFFNGLEIANGGDEFLNYIESYKSSLISTVALSNPDIAGMIKSTFDIGSIEDRRGVQTNWLTLNYKGFPAIASVIKLSEMQANVKHIEKNFYESILNVKYKVSDDVENSLLKKNSVATNTKITSNDNKVEVKPTKTEETVKPIKKEETTTKKVTTPKKKVKKVKASSNSAKTHTVGKGDTLYKIAKKYGISTSVLKKLNGMTNNNLVPGQKLKIKK